MSVFEYLIDSNQTQAAIRAGYSPKTAAAQGNRLLKNVKIAALLEQKKAKLNNKLEITQEKVLQEIARIAFSDVRNVATWNAESVSFLDSEELSDDAAAAIVEVSSVRTAWGEDGERTTLKIKLANKLEALEKLAKHLGLYSGPEPDGNMAKEIADLILAMDRVEEGPTDEEIEEIGRDTP